MIECANRIFGQTADNFQRLHLANHGKPWDRKAMGTNVSQSNRGFLSRRREPAALGEKGQSNGGKGGEKLRSRGTLARRRCYVSPAAGEFGNPSERVAAQSREAKVRGGASPRAMLVRPPDTLHPLEK